MSGIHDLTRLPKFKSDGPSQWTPITICMYWVLRTELVVIKHVPWLDSVSEGGGGVSWFEMWVIDLELWVISLSISIRLKVMAIRFTIRWTWTAKYKRSAYLNSFISENNSVRAYIIIDHLIRSYYGELQLPQCVAHHCLTLQIGTLN